MKLMRLGSPGAERPAVRTDDGRVWDLTPVTGEIDGASFSSDGPERARAAVKEGGLTELDPTALRVGAPVARPGNVVCTGLNYRDHAEETGAPVPPRPVVFLKDPGTVVGPYDEVLIPRGSARTDGEVELAVVIGSRARYLESPAEGRRHVAGYAIGNDVSERESQLDCSPQGDLGSRRQTFAQT